jgi:ribosomal protein S18 acetylase RimI-like enzyme
MDIEIRELPMTILGEYARIPIAFEVHRVLDIAVQQNDVVFEERALDLPYVKDYDVDTREGPTQWGGRFDLSNWGLLAARSQGRLMGGAVIAFSTPGVTMLEGRHDLAVLWDIRVAPEARGKGIGSALFRAAEAWATDRKCRQLKVETQNINVAACRFYERHGCAIGEFHRSAYPEFPDEIQLLWYKELSAVNG